jgi:pimeloyl-ACP methyl ester carboxylesterase
LTKGDIDAALNGMGKYAGKVYFFKGDKYIRYDWRSEKVDQGAVPIASWNFPPDFKSNLDAALNGMGKYAGKVYFFKGDKYIRYDWRSEKVDQGAVPIHGNWVPLSFSRARQLSSPPIREQNSKKIPIILIPGIMGTSLVTINKKSELWPTTWGSDFRKLALDSRGNDIANNKLRPHRILRTFWNKKIYEPFFQFFIRSGYREGINLFEFPYDWRKDLRLASFNLSTTIEQIKGQTGSNKVILIAHSMGGLVARRYLMNTGSTNSVEKLFMLGTPHCGAPKAFTSIRFGKQDIIPKWVPWGPTAFDIMLATGNMPGLYMLLPSKRYETLNKGGFLALNGRSLNIDETYNTYGGINPQIANDAMFFHKEIDYHWIVSPFPETYLFVGRTGYNSTIGKINVNVSSKPVQASIVYQMVQGDTTVPTVSSESLVVPSNRIFISSTTHDSLPTDNQILTKILSLI